MNDYDYLLGDPADVCLEDDLSVWAKRDLTPADYRIVKDLNIGLAVEEYGIDQRVPAKNQRYRRSDEPHVLAIDGPYMIYLWRRIKYPPFSTVAEAAAVARQELERENVRRKFARDGLVTYPIIDPEVQDADTKSI